MKIKTVRILDSATEVWYLIGKPDSSDYELMESTGWGVQPVTLLINLKRGGGVEGCMATFRGSIPYDLQEYGPLDVNGTTIKLAEIVRDMPFEDIPEVLDVRKYPQ